MGQVTRMIASLRWLHYGRHTPPGQEGVGPEDCICHTAFPIWRRIPCYLEYFQLHHIRSVPYSDPNWISRWHYRTFGRLVWVAADRSDQ